MKTMKKNNEAETLWILKKIDFKNENRSKSKKGRKDQYSTAMLRRLIFLEGWPLCGWPSWSFLQWTKRGLLPVPWDMEAGAPL